MTGSWSKAHSYSAIKEIQIWIHKYATFLIQRTKVHVYNIRVGPAIWGLQNRAKGPKYFSKKGYFGHKTGPQKPDRKEFFDVEEHLSVKNNG